MNHQINKRCSKKLLLGNKNFFSDSESENDKQAEVEKESLISGLEILSNSESDSDYEIFSKPKKKKVQKVENTDEYRTYVSPSTSKKFTVLENAHVHNVIDSPDHKIQIPTGFKQTVLSKEKRVKNLTNMPPLPQTLSNENNAMPLRVSADNTNQDFEACKKPSVAVPTPTILLTPTQKRQLHDIDVCSQISTPESISRFCTSSRCPSLSNISLMPLYEDENVSENNSQCKNLTASEDVERTFEDENEKRKTDTGNIERKIKRKKTGESQLKVEQKAKGKIMMKSKNNKTERNDKTLNKQLEEKENPMGKNITQKGTDYSKILSTNINMVAIENEIDNNTTEELLTMPSNNNTSDNNVHITVEERRYISESESEISLNDIDDENVSTEISSSSSSEADSESVIENERLESQEQDFGDESWVDINEDVPNFIESTLSSEILVPTENKTPIEIYNLFITEDIINKIVKETNDYAEKYLVENENTIKLNSRVKAWNPVNSEEIRQFFGVILIMGLNKIPHLSDYWSRKTIYRNEYICSIFARDRFLLILKFWHFSDSSIIETDDKLHKFRQIYESLNSRFQSILKPGKIVVIDETMIPWRGRLKFRQYIKNKSHKYGVKIYKLCTPEGYTYRMIVYTGKEGNKREQDHGLKIVMKLVAGLEDEGRTIVADNFYSSIKLAELLLTRKTFYCGTLRSNRKGLPKNIVCTKVKKGEVHGKMSQNGVRIIKWCDKRQVLMLTTCKGHKAELVNTGKQSRSNEPIKKPKCVLMYNDNKKGIDYSDQMASYYSVLKRGLKWYRKVVMEFLFGTSVVNAWLIYNMSNTKKISKKDFTECLIESLTGKNISDNGNNEQNLSESKHVFAKGQTRKRCVVCYAKLRLSLGGTQAAKKTKKILTSCATCKQAMCLGCFNERHSN